MKTTPALPANSRFSGTGVETNHSSMQMSTETTVPDNHAQFDDQLADIPYQTDPNMSGTTETAQMHDWEAGKLNEWEENDCYRDFLQTGEAPVSRIYGEAPDADFDSNWGRPTPIPSYSSGGSPDMIPTDLAPVIRRRL